jgi:hypothetical protein
LLALLAIVAAHPITHPEIEVSNVLTQSADFAFRQSLNSYRPEGVCDPSDSCSFLCFDRRTAVCMDQSDIPVEALDGGGRVCRGSRRGVATADRENINCCPRAHGNYIPTDNPPLVSNPTIAPDGQRDPTGEEAFAASVPISLTSEVASTFTEDERVMGTIYNTYGNWITTTAETMGIPRAALAAVVKLESRGSGFSSRNGDRVTIRFENHVFWSRWGKCHSTQYDMHFDFDSNHKTRHKINGITSEEGWIPFPHTSQAQDWEVFNFARHLNEDAAIMSTSFGAGQVMGFNYEKVGYNTPVEFFTAVSTSLEAHLRAMAEYIRNTEACFDAVQTVPIDFIAFGVGYNGKTSYGVSMQKFHDAFLSLLTKAGISQ